jgi:hypothetical protein
MNRAGYRPRSGRDGRSNMTRMLFHEEAVERSRGPRVQSVDDPRRGDPWQSNGRYPRIAAIPGRRARFHDASPQRHCFLGKQEVRAQLPRGSRCPSIRDSTLAFGEGVIKGDLVLRQTLIFATLAGGSDVLGEVDECPQNLNRADRTCVASGYCGFKTLEKTFGLDDVVFSASGFHRSAVFAVRRAPDFSLRVAEPQQGIRPVS